MLNDEPALDFPKYAPDFNVLAYLRPDILSPEILARRTIELVSRLEAIHPLFENWLWGEWEDDDDPVVETPFDVMRKDLAAAIGRKRSPYPGQPWIPGQNGYFYSLLNTRPADSAKGVAVSVSAGGWDSLNQSRFDTSYWCPADPDLLTFEVTRAVTLAICESFQAMFCYAFPHAIAPFRTEPGRCMIGSLIYLGPAGAALVTPPPGVVAEHRPDGGLLMAATRDRFDVGDPIHIAAARAIHAAIAPYNALPDAI